MPFTNTSDVIGAQEALDALAANTLTELNQDDVTYLRPFALYNKTALTSVNFPNVVKTNNKNTYAMNKCTNLVNATFDKMNHIPIYMFSECTALAILNFPSATSIEQSAFTNCSNLETVNLPNVTSLGSYCFDGCSKLKNLTLGVIKSVSSYSFRNCSSLTSFDFSNLGTGGLHIYAFYNTGLTEVILTNITHLDSDVFEKCKKLNLVDIDSTSKQRISAEAIASSGLRHFIIRYTDDVANLESTNALSNTPIANGIGAIYVPTSLVDAYKAETNWSAYADQIHSIDEYPITSFGTITDSWTDIFAAESDGTYSTKYNIGDTKSVLVDNVPVMMQIAAFDEDDSKITWLCRDVYTNHRMNATNTSIGGWADSEMRSYLINDVLPNIESTVREHIVAVDKTYYDYNSGSTLVSVDSIWIPSAREVALVVETSGIQYSELFSDSPSRIKKNITEGAVSWCLRSTYTATRFLSINVNGNNTNVSPTSEFGVVFGFCT